VGFRPQLVVVSGHFGGNPFDGGILAFHGAFGYHEALSQTFPLSLWNSGYRGDFSKIFLSHDGISAITQSFHEFFFHTMEFCLSRSLFTNFSHDGISAIKEPSHELFFFTMEYRLSRSPFHEIFARWNLCYQGTFS
jgi:hypothetical protein